MKLDQELQDYLDKNNLTVDVIGFRPAVFDREGNVICMGGTVHTAVRKAIWLSSICPHYYACERKGPVSEPRS
ncbi:MAG: hypothetical protein MESAZ_01577 [Saezia sanguinis]